MEKIYVSFESIGIVPSPHGFNLTEENPEKDGHYYLYYTGDGFEEIIQCGGKKAQKTSNHGAFLGAISKECAKENIAIWIKKTINSAVQRYNFIPKPEWSMERNEFDEQKLLNKEEGMKGLRAFFFGSGCHPGW